MAQNKMREEMTAAFIAALKEDKIPWRRGWEDDLPVNAVTGKKYRSNNMVWLSYLATEKEYKDPRWCTYKQAADSGWQVKKGEKGAHIEFWSLYDLEEKKKITFAESIKLQEELSLEEYSKRVKPVSNGYTVFNGEQIDGIPEYDRKHEEINPDEILGYRDKLIANMDLTLIEGGQSAFYRPSSDSITMPIISKFENSYEYMSTFLHECGHATGREKRLHRDLSGTFGSESYAKEELRAEISSAFTTAELGINTGFETEHMKNHKAYIQSWVSVLENDPNELFRAIKDAEKISDYLIEKGEFKVKEETPEQETKLDYRLYQMNEGDKYHGFHFSPLDENKKFGTLTIDDYHSVYEGSFDDVSGASTLEKLESLFSGFQVSLPEGYTGYSMSTSDVVVITDKTTGTETAYYCDRYGFVEYPEFLQKKEVEQEKQPEQVPATSILEMEQLLKSLPDEPPEDVLKEAERELSYMEITDEIIKENIQENTEHELTFAEQVDRVLAGDKKFVDKPLIIGKTPNALVICGADKNLDIQITKRVIDKALRPEVRDENGKLSGKTGHGLTVEQLLNSIESIKNPVMVLKGSKENSLVAVTELKDNNDREIIVTVEMNKTGSCGEVNNITSTYGRNAFAKYIEKQLVNGNMIAANKKRADEMLLSIGKWYPEAMAFISYDDSIVYSMENVKRLNENNIKEKADLLADTGVQFPQSINDTVVRHEETIHQNENDVNIQNENNTKDEVIKEKNFTYHGTDYEVIDRWQDSTGKYVIGQTIDANGVWYAAKVTDNTEQYKGVYEYEFDKRPSHKEVEGEHIDNIAQIDLDHYEAEYGADGRRAFPHLNEPELMQK